MVQGRIRQPLGHLEGAHLSRHIEIGTVGHVLGCQGLFQLSYRYTPGANCWKCCDHYEPE